MTNPSETRDSELVAGLGLHDDSEPTLAGLTRIVRDGYLPDDYRSSARAAYDKLREAADTIDRLTSSGAGGVTLTLHRTRPIGSDRWSEWRLGPANLSPASGCEWEDVDFSPASPREVPVERSTADDLTYLLECVSAHADKFPVPTHMTALVARIRAALPHNQGETKP